MSATIDRTSSTPKKVLVVVADPGVSEIMGWPIGFWASELVHPWYEFVERGYEVTIASPDGGKVEADLLSDPRDESGYSADDVLSTGFLSTPRLTALLEDTPKLADLDLDGFDAIVVSGGQAPMYQFRDNADLQATLRHFYEAEKPTASLCHGVSALINVKLSDDSCLIEGKTMTGFANVEEDAASEAASEAAGQTIQPPVASRTLPGRGGPTTSRAGCGRRTLSGTGGSSQASSSTRAGRSPSWSSRLWEPERGLVTDVLPPQRERSRPGGSRPLP